MNNLQTNLPVEILQLIASKSTYLHIVFGLGVNKRIMFLEGGPGIVLETILKNGADIKCLLSIKRYIPAKMAIAKAVLTKNISITKRVCDIWDSTMSYHAFMLSFINQFKWGVEHIQTKSKMHPWILNAVYAATGDLEKIDFTIQDPLRTVGMYDHLYKQRYDDLMKYIKDIKKKVDIHLKCKHPERAIELITAHSYTVESIDAMLIKLNGYGYLKEAVELFKMFPEKVHSHPMRLLCSKNPDNVNKLRLYGIEDDIPLIMAIVSRDIDQIIKELKMDEHKVLLSIKQLNLESQFHDKLDLSDASKLFLLGDEYPQYYPLEYEKMCFFPLPNEQDPQYINIMTRLFLRQTNEHRRLEMIENKIIQDIDVVLDVIIHEEGQRSLTLLRRFIDIHGLQAFEQVNQYQSLETSNDLQSEFWFIKIQKNKCLNYYEYCNDDKLWLFNMCAELQFKGVKVSNAWTLPTIDIKNKVIYYSYTDITYIPISHYDRIYSDKAYKDELIQEVYENMDSILAPWAYFENL